jgi:cytochrome c oxidase subunit III
MAMHAAAAPHHASENIGISRGMAGMALFIGSEIMLFGGLFAAYFFVRNQADTWPPESIEHTVAKDLGAVLTAILISSSVAAHIGILGLQKSNQTLFKLGLGVAIVLGTIFIGGQIYEWFQLWGEGLNATSSAYGSTFFIITGFHGAHVIAGLAMLIAVFVRAFWGDFTAHRHLFAESSILYWHFVDVIWVFVFSILYLSY